MKLQLVRTLAASALLLLGAPSLASHAAGGGPQPFSGQAGTTLSATKTASGFWTRRIEYNWTLQKAANPTSLTLGTGQSANVGYTLTTTRTPGAPVDEYGVEGQICVTNGGALATENLKIVDQVQYKVGSGAFQDLTGASVTMTPAQLAAGASACYAYHFTFTPVPNAIYRNVAHVTITNHSGWLPGSKNCPGPAVCPFGPDPKADFSLPGSPTVQYVDATADLTDSLVCPTGFTCSPTSHSWHLTDGGVLTYNVRVTNVSAPCNTTVPMVNTATLTEGDTHQTHTASATVNLYTGPCAGGCTLTIGYWKTHSAQITPLLPIWLGTAGGAQSVQVTTASQAVTLLNMSGNASNGINKLYAQELAAKLNIARGASATAVAATLAAADSFLATHNSASWASLSAAERQQVLAWATTLDNYNNGLIGPSHCSQ
jgi:hypothetical protein